MSNEEMERLEHPESGEAIDPQSPAGVALDPENAVDTEVKHRKGAFGDDTSTDGGAPIP